MTPTQSKDFLNTISPSLLSATLYALISGILQMTRLRILLQPFYSYLDFVRDNWKSQQRKGKTSLDLLEQEIVSGSGISWAICRQITKTASNHSVFTGRMPFLPPNQQHQSTESK